jgi:hypothetical protein
MLSKPQYVCLVCGFNMIGFHPNNCPFCGAHKSSFLTMEEIMEKYYVKEMQITDKVTQLRSSPPLGYEHAAYRLDSNFGEIWIDCPSSYDPNIRPPKTIFFTHHHFMGSSNLYGEFGGTEIRIHDKDSMHSISKRFTFDVTFEGDFTFHELEAFHINGHTPGFTFYIFENALLICDYIFLSNKGLRYNPYGDISLTEEGGRMISRIIEGREIEVVCASNYSIEFKDWLPKFNELLSSKK